MNADGSGQTNLTNSVTSNNTNPSWSPDGSRIAFQSDRNGDDEIYSMNSDGSGTPTNLTQDPSAQDFSPSWSPDGAKIAFTKSTFQAGLDVYVVSADGSGQQTNLTASDSSENKEPSWSPDGGRIAFVSNRAGDDDIWLMNATDGSSPQQLTANPATDFAPAWSPD